MPTIRIKLSDTEHKALISLALCEQRDPRAQAALLIRRALTRRKRSTSAPPPAQANPPAPLPDEEMPDWLRSMGEPATPPAQGEPLPNEELPDWLRSMGDVKGGKK